MSKTTSSFLAGDGACSSSSNQCPQQYTRGMLADCAVEALRVEQAPITTKNAEKYEELLIMRLTTPLQQEVAAHLARLEGDDNTWQKWESMVEQRNERVTRLEQVATRKNHQDIWPIYKYTHERIPLANGKVYLKTPPQIPSVRLKNSTTNSNNNNSNNNRNNSKEKKATSRKEKILPEIKEETPLNSHTRYVDPFQHHHIPEHQHHQQQQQQLDEEQYSTFDNSSCDNNSSCSLYIVKRRPFNEQISVTSDPGIRLLSLDAKNYFS